MPAAAAPHLAVAGLVPAVAELEHLAEDRDAAAGQAGQHVERGAHRGRRGVVAVVEDRHAPGRTSSPRCVRRRRHRQAGGDLVEVEARPAARPTAAAARALWTAWRPSAGSLDRLVRRRRSASTEAHPVDAGAIDVAGGHVGVGREAVGQRPGRVRARHPRDPLVVGVEDRRAVGAAAPRRSSPLAALDRLDRADPRQVDRLDGGHDADPRAGRCAARSAISPPTYMPISRTAASVAGPRRSSGQRQADLVVLVALVAQRPAVGPPGRPRPPPWSRSWRCCRSRPRRAGRTDAASRPPSRPAPRRGRPTRTTRDRAGRVERGVIGRG